MSENTLDSKGLVVVDKPNVLQTAALSARSQTYERWLGPAFFAFIGIFTVVDIITDLGEEVLWSHLTMEISIAAVSFAGLFYFLRKTIVMKHALQNECARSSQAIEDAANWKHKNQKLILGFSDAIEDQFKAWKLTPAENDIALFLLKGFSASEIADLRGASEKTVKQQCTAVYAKSGLAGRAELSAFFLEEVLGSK